MPDNPYIAYESDLTAVADAIRSKGGTSADLEFPDEWIDAIDAIQTGGDDDMPPLIPDDGKVHIGISFPDNSPSNRMAMQICFSQSVSEGVLVDWGDSHTERFTGTDAKTVGHTYSAIGDYDITLEVTSGTLGFSTNICGATNTASYQYHNLIDYIYFYGDIAFMPTTTSSNQGICAWLRRVRRIIFPTTLPQGSRSIGGYACYYCYSLREVILPPNITSLEVGAFYYCYSLQKIDLPSTITAVGNNAFNYCCSLREISFPSNVSTIGLNAFFNAHALQKVTLPDNLVSIGNSFLQGAPSIRNLVIPSGVTSLGNNFCYSCYSLGEVHVLASTPPSLGTYAFASALSDLKIYVPSASVDAYKAATNWSSQSSKIYGE